MKADHRTPLLAKIHIAKKQLGLDDGDYRAIVARVIGEPSSKGASIESLERLLAEFTRLGFKPAPAFKTSRKQWVRKIYALWAELAPLLDDATDATLNGFVVRQTHSERNPAGISNPEWLDPKDGTKVIQGLQGWLARVKAAKGKAA